MSDFTRIFSELISTGAFLERYDSQFSLVKAEKTTRQIQIFMRDLNKKAENEVYERAAKDLTIYKEFVDFTKRRLQAAPVTPTVI